MRTSSLPLTLSTSVHGTQPVHPGAPEGGHHAGPSLCPPWRLVHCPACAEMSEELRPGFWKGLKEVPLIYSESSRYPRVHPLLYSKAFTSTNWSHPQSLSPTITTPCVQTVWKGPGDRGWVSQNNSLRARGPRQVGRVQILFASPQ